MALTSRATHVLQWCITEGGEVAIRSETQKVHRSPDWSLQLDSMKSESLVIANQNVAVNTFPGLVHTARPHPWEWVVPEVDSLTLGRGVLPRYDS